MTQPVVALLGLSGVGKSTILRKLAAHIAFQHLQASAIIKAAQKRNGLPAPKSMNFAMRTSTTIKLCLSLAFAQRVIPLPR